MTTVLTNTKPYFLLSLILVALTSACGLMGGAEEPTPAPPVEVRYISFLADGETNNVESKLIAQFEATHPHITVARSQYQQQPTAYLNQDPPPDILVVVADYETFSLIDAGEALDISAVWQDTNLAQDYPATLRTFGEREGRQYFLPVAHTWTAIYYNQALFLENNLAPPETWDELQTIANKFWQQGITPFALAQNDAWSVTMWFEYLSVRLHGPEFQADLLAGLVPYDDFRVQQVFETWRDLIEDGYFGEGQTSRGVVQSVDSVYAGEAAMILTSPILLQDVPESFYDRLSFFSFPEIDPSQPMVEITPAYGYFIPAKTAHPSQASELLIYMSSVEVQTTLVQQIGDNFGILPAHRKVDAANLPPISQNGLTLIRQADSILRPFDFATPSSFSAQAESAFRSFLRDPTTLLDVIDRLEQARQQAY